MANRKNYYPLPDYKTVTEDLDAYMAAWREVAQPIEEHLGLTLSGFDPEFVFTKGSPQGASTSVRLPTWFARDLSEKLKAVK